MLEKILGNSNETIKSIKEMNKDELEAYMEKHIHEMTAQELTDASKTFFKDSFGRTGEYSGAIATQALYLVNLAGEVGRRDTYEKKF